MTSMFALFSTSSQRGFANGVQIAFRRADDGIVFGFHADARGRQVQGDFG
jgi:hypothetical protein